MSDFKKDFKGIEIPIIDDDNIDYIKINSFIEIIFLNDLKRKYIRQKLKLADALSKLSISRKTPLQEKIEAELERIEKE